MGLARFYERTCRPPTRELADAWLAVADDPTLILDATRFKAGDPRVPAILADGLSRWRRRDALAALAALDALKARDRRWLRIWPSKSGYWPCGSPATTTQAH